MTIFVYCIQNGYLVTMKISSSDLGKQAYHKVKQMIVSKKLLPGQKIVQEQLAEQLGISRTPLRDALQRLEAELLVESIPRRGVVVRQFNDREIVEIYECRIALEVTAVRLFAEKAQQSQIDGLRKLLEPFEHTNEIDEKAYQKADSNFHDTIIKRSGNQFLYQLFQKGNLLVCIDAIGLVRPPKETLQEHLDIVTAIHNRDGAKAASLLKEHLEKSKRLIVENPGYEN